jgi:hypothetical protein
MQPKNLLAAVGISAVLGMASAFFATLELGAAGPGNIVAGAGATATQQYGQTTMPTNSFAPSIKVAPYVGGDWTPVATAP